MKLVLVALAGSGKTTIMNFVRERLPDVRIVNFGDAMLEIARRKFGIENRDDMRKKIPVEEYRKIQEEAAEHIASIQGDVIIDTHASIKIGGGYYPGLPNRVVSKLRPDVILVIEYSPKVILERRRKDPTRFREIESEEEIEQHQQANRYFAFAAANASESTVHILDFRDKVEERPFVHAELAAEYIVNLFLKARGK
ncbi:MAG: adenylate kinase [Pyrobaculum sp.]